VQELKKESGLSMCKVTFLLSPQNGILVSQNTNDTDVYAPFPASMYVSTNWTYLHNDSIVWSSYSVSVPVKTWFSVQFYKIPLTTAFSDEGGLIKVFSDTTIDINHYVGKTSLYKMFAKR
jgi:hypothetical protein